MIYVLCPSNVKTGGTELLHQLVYELNKNQIEAIIAYFNSTKETILIPEFKEYVNDYVDISIIEDNEKNIVIIPETATQYIQQFNKAKIYLWWLSVDHYMWNNVRDIESHYKIFKTEYGVIKEIAILIKRNLFYKKIGNKPLPISEMKKVKVHMVQSIYAQKFLEKHGIKNIAWLSDYINEQYLNNCEKVNIVQKKDIVLYNPGKGSRILKPLMQKYKNIAFVPIVNMTNKQVAECLEKAKVYIDFGRHPGKDRIPREAALMKCCVITGRRGSAQYDDVPIGDEFKFRDSKKNIDLIYKKIMDIFENYDTYVRKFEEYRNKIIDEKNLFEKNVKQIFGNLL